jgi:streptogramin lyase
LKTRLYHFLFSAVLLLFAGNLLAQAPSPGTVNFTTSPPTVNLSSTTGVQTYVPSGATAANGQGLEFVIEGSAGSALQIQSNNTTSNNLTFTRSATSLNITKIRIRSAATGSVSNTNTTLNNTGDTFGLTSISVYLLSGTRTLTFTGYRNGTQVDQVTFAATTTKSVVSFPTTFGDVDELAITNFATGTSTTNGQNGIRIDDIVIAASAPAPVISYATPQVYTINTGITPLLPTVTGTVGGSTAYNTSFNFVAVADTYEVDIDAAGNVYSVNGTNGDLYKYNSAGVGGIINTTNLVSPSGLGVDGLGNIYVADFTSGPTGGTYAVLKFNNTGTLLATMTGFNQPYGIAFDAANNAYVSNLGTNSIIKINAGTTTTSTYISGLANPPYGLAIDQSGNMYIGSNTGNTIAKVAAGTTTVSAFIPGTAGLNGPRQLSTDALGNIFVADFGNNAIKKITPGGVITALLTAGQASSPRGATLDASGNLYFANNGTGYVKKATPLGLYYIDKTLPAGMSFDNTTGKISGTPTVISPATDYTVTAYNATGSGSTIVNITVAPVAPTVAPVATLCGSGPATIIASGGTPTGGTYNFYNVATGGTALQSTTATSYIVPNVFNTSVYYVSYTVSGVTSTRTPVTIGVNPKVATPLTNTNIAYPFNNTFEDVSGNRNDATSYGATPPNPTADRYGTPASAYTFNGTNQYLSSSITNYDPQVYSLSLWFRTTTNLGGKLIGFVQSATPGASGQFDRHIYMNTAGNLYFGVYIGGFKTMVSPKTYNDGFWHHVVVTVAPATATSPVVPGAVMYVDGVSVITNTTITGGEPHNGYWRIGGDDLTNWTSTTGASYFFNGDIDDVAVYHRSLTPAEATGSNDLNLIGNTTAYCQNNTITLTAPSITGATYKWVDNVTPANTYTGNPGVFANASSGTYTLTVTSGGCQSTAIITPGSPTYTWTGAAGTTATNTAGNWTHTSTGEVGFIPPPFAGNETIIIPATATVFPSLTATTSIYTLNIGAGASLSLNGNTLNVGCNVYNNNTTAAGILYGPAANGNTNSQLTWGGTVLSQNYIGATTTTPAQVGKMTVNNINSSTGTISIISGKLDVYNLLTMTKGKLDVAAAATLTLKSTSTLTASVPTLTGTTTPITGNVTVERWFTGGSTANRGWRLMGSPVNNSGVVPASASAVYNFASYKTNLPVTGPGGTGNGFDTATGYIANGPTILLYDTPTFLFSSPATLTSTTKVGSGFYFYFRGNRTNLVNKLVRPFNNPEANVVALQTGSLNQQGFTYTLSNGGRRYNQVGNPYPSSISVSSANLTGTTGFVYVYNSSGNSIGTSPGAATIASGQGFFVITTATGPSSVLFTESMKVATQPTGAALLMGKPVGTQEPGISLKMIQDSSNYDFTYIRFLDTYKNNFDELEDAEDINGQGQAVFFSALTTDKRLVAVASQPLDKQKTSVFLSVNDNAGGLFTLQKQDLSGIPPAYDVWLMDHFKKDSLDLRNNDTYAFNIDKANTATFGADRFELVIRKKSLPPYKLISFGGKRTGAEILLKWNTVNEFDYTSFELQKSTDGVNFESVKNMQSGSVGNYSFKDVFAGLSDVYYRLKQVDINDRVSYSEIIIISTKGDGALLSIFPNPASNIIQFQLKADVKGPIRLKIFNSMGILMKSSSFTSSTGGQDISSLIPGSYTIELSDLNSKKILLTGKFIKI